MNKQQAQELADTISSIYATPDNGIRVNLPDLDGKPEFENLWYVGIWIGNELVSTIDRYKQLDAWRKFAAILVQTDEDIRQEEDFSLLVDGPSNDGNTDLPENTLSAQALSEGWHL